MTNFIKNRWVQFFGVAFVAAFVAFFFAGSDNNDTEVAQTNTVVETVEVNAENVQAPTDAVEASTESNTTNTDNAGETAATPTDGTEQTANAEGENAEN